MMFAAALVLGTTHSKGASQPVTITPGVPISYLHPVALAAAPTGSRVLVCMEDGTVRIVDAKTHQTVKSLAKHLGPAYAAAWSADGLFVATGDETARIFIESAVSGAKIREYRTHTKGIQKLSFNVTRQYLLSTGKDDQINVYDLNKPTTKEVRKFLGKGANFYGATFSPTLPYAFSTGILGPGGRTYDAVSGHQTGFLVTQNDEGVFDLGYNPAGTREVTAGKNGEACVFDARTLKKIGALKGHQDFIMYAAFSPNGQLIATGSTDRTVKIWNAYTYTKVAELQGQNTVGSPVVFTADGSTLATVSDSGYLQFSSLSPIQAAVQQPAVSARPKKHRHHSNDGRKR